VFQEVDSQGLSRSNSRNRYTDLVELSIGLATWTIFPICEGLHVEQNGGIFDLITDC
jgi:hypothetical protein